ncbi:hypothetical protein ROLI_029360 [Roseobacter fucihabitans]|uniref:Uncharacterized protein n=1 Tax=Roseobacter fucihabitans TaxID=1537242 RepID=A0ABZ2BWZ7_9RHOB|nr:hypothetical protein [Roseobacter litoralis]
MGKPYSLDFRGRICAYVAGGAFGAYCEACIHEDRMTNIHFPGQFQRRKGAVCNTRRGFQFLSGFSGK